MLSGAVFLALGLGLFWPFLFGGEVLFTNDAVITAARHDSVSLLQTFIGSWRDDILAGLPRYVSINLPTILRRVMGVELWNDSIWLLANFLSSLAMLWVLRQQRIQWLPAIIGTVTACWLGANFTLVYSGHTMKAYVVLFFLVSLGFTHRFAVRGRWTDAVFLGASAGAMFMHQADMAFLFSLVLAPWVVVELALAGRWRLPSTFGFLAIAAVVCGLLSAGPLLNGYRYYAAHVAKADDPDQKWAYMTQWSWPPEDMPELVAPGYMGWRSNDAQGVYRGRLGRTPEVIKDGERYANLKMESYYLGILPVVLALAAVWGFRRSPDRVRVWFWMLVAVVTLLLSFGKYTPLYRWYFELPIVDTIRNPNKFLQIFQVAVAICAAFGAQLLLGTKAPAPKDRLLATTSDALLVVALLALGWGVYLRINEVANIRELMNAGLPGDFAEAAARLRATSIFHLALMSGLGAYILKLSRWKKTARILHRWPAIPGILMVALMLADVVLLADHYIRPMPRSFIAQNILTADLSAGSHRTVLLNRSGVDNILTGFSFPFHGIRTLNVNLLPRMPADYAEYLAAMRTNPVGLWRQTGTDRIIATRDEAAKLVPDFLREILCFEVKPAADGGIVISENPDGEYLLLEPLEPDSRFVLVAGAERVDPGTALKRLPLRESFDKLLVEDDASPLEGSGLVGTVDVTREESGEIDLRIYSPGDAYLRIAQRYDPDWRAWVDGKPETLQRADFLFQAVRVPAGVHVVRLGYRPPLLFFALQLCGLLAVAVAAGIAFMQIRPKRGAR